MNVLEHPDTFDVIVIGGGHAGCEAALAAARVGASTLLVTQSIEAIGQMSCNPAIGGVGKSHLVREIDALGGAMAQVADRAGIHYRVLNASKGPAVRATRAQTDRARYRTAMREIIESQEGLSVFQQAVVDLDIQDGRVTGVVTQMGLRFRAQRVVLTTGTFLGGRIHIGDTHHGGGRAGDAPSIALAERLRALPFRVDRLKTGTPPRIDARSVDFTELDVQPGDEPRPALSYLAVDGRPDRQLVCHIAHTNEQTHDIIRAALDRSPLFTGAIEGVGPRYCPSIEDKVVRFAERVQHQLFIEPEGLDTHELYPNGISTSLPFDVQYALVRSIRGFERAHITRPGYAIEYDFFDPRDLEYSLETRAVQGLYFAGQINGTTGYEEAAAQGLLAGLNAARAAAGKEPWWPARDQAYLGVLVDDLIMLGTNEPYRMFTSRAEYRLRLREDNADLRLTGMGRELGLVSGERWRAFEVKRDRVERVRALLDRTHVVAGSDLARLLEASTGEQIRKDVNVSGLLRRPRVRIDQLADWINGQLDATNAGSSQPSDVLLAVETDVKYEGYIARQDEEIARIRRHEGVRIPQELDFTTISGLSAELCGKLTEAKPESLARAARIPGMTPAALSLVLVHARRLQASA